MRNEILVCAHQRQFWRLAIADRHLEQMHARFVMKGRLCWKAPTPNILNKQNKALYRIIENMSYI